MEEEDPGDRDVLEVEPEAAGSQLLEFLSRRLVKVSKKTLRHLISQGEIRLNRRAARPQSRVRQGDVVWVPRRLDDSAPKSEQEAPLEIDVLHDDEHHVVINKPAGYPVMPDRRGEQREFYASVLATLNAHRPAGGPYVRPHMLHRLDRETSGVLAVAKSREASRALSKQFERGEVRKVYVAVVEGRFPRDEVRIDLPLAREQGSVLRMTPDEKDGKPAETRVRVKERLGHFSLLEVRPQTGRQHQIRVHLAATGYPLAVDFLYGRRESLTREEFCELLGKPGLSVPDVVLDRCPLHAASLSYAHPATGQPTCIEAPLPRDLEVFLSILREFDPEPK